MYEFREDEKVIGSSKLEHGDPPMGFAHGEFISVGDFSGAREKSKLSAVHLETGEELACTSVVIEVYEELQEMYVTIQVESSEEDEKYFSHHKKTYENQFS